MLTSMVLDIPGERIEEHDTFSFLNPTSICRWAPGHELLAALSVNGELIGYRVKSKSRAWLIYRRIPAIQDFAWRPDGRELAVGFSDGSLALFDGETGQQTHKVQFGLRKLGKIAHLAWVDDGLGVPPMRSTADKICYDPRCTAPHRREPHSYTLLAAWDENMQVNLRLQGYLDVGWAQANVPKDIVKQKLQ
ncbi:hypothetical protein BC829DRAFT_27344 [Chytridium lagenaria]|nr:hypothetical protein BC829DRAFT_27344 [Chytridium lagenaria]